jgi:hypothetical protein
MAQLEKEQISRISNSVRDQRSNTDRSIWNAMVQAEKNDNFQLSFAQRTKLKKFLNFFSNAQSQGSQYQ